MRAVKTVNLFSLIVVNFMPACDALHVYTWLYKYIPVWAWPHGMRWWGRSRGLGRPTSARGAEIDSDWCAMGFGGAPGSIRVLLHWF